MKRTIAALALVIGMAPAMAAAQSSIVSQIAGDKVATESLYFSLKFGLNFSYLKGTAETGRTGGFNIGISATIKLTERLSLVPEITPFIRKGVSKIPLGTTGDPALDVYFADLTASELALSYIDIPVLITYRLGRFHLGAGPCVSFLTDATERFRAELQTGQELSFKREVTARYKSADYGLVVEASWTITKPRRGTGLVFHLRYQGGLTNVLREYSGPLAVLAPGPFRNSVIQACLSFPFVH
jgi:hypothetical protein